ncbi:MAG: hypothetical protein MHPSP_002102, partial [Paramarteilia canceri]
MFALVSYLDTNVIIDKDLICMVRQNDKWMDAGCNQLESGNEVKFFKLAEKKILNGKLLHLGSFYFINNLKMELDGEAKKPDTTDKEKNMNSQKVEMLERELENLKKENDELNIYKMMFLHLCEEFEKLKKTFHSLLKDCDDANF